MRKKIPYDVPTSIYGLTFGGHNVMELFLYGQLLQRHPNGPSFTPSYILKIKISYVVIKESTSHFDVKRACAPFITIRKNNASFRCKLTGRVADSIFKGFHDGQKPCNHNSKHVLRVGCNFQQTSPANTAQSNCKYFHTNSFQRIGRSSYSIE